MRVILVNILFAKHKTLGRFKSPVQFREWNSKQVEADLLAPIHQLLGETKISGQSRERDSFAGKTVVRPIICDSRHSSSKQLDSSNAISTSLQHKSPSSSFQYRTRVQRKRFPDWRVLSSSVVVRVTDLTVIERMGSSVLSISILDKHI